MDVTTTRRSPTRRIRSMRIADVRDLFAFLKTLPAVEGKVRDHDLPFPFNIRRTLGGWKFLFLDGKPFQPDQAKPPEWNRGAYLVNAPGHCAECHSPRNAARRHRREPALHRRARSRRRGLGPEHHAEGAGGLFRQGHRLPAGDRRYAERGLGRRRDDGGRAQHGAALARGPQRHGGLRQVAAPSRGTETAGKERVGAFSGKSLPRT